MSDNDGAYYALYLQEQQENKELKARIKELEERTIWGFYEDEFPVYTHWPEVSELSEIVTAKELNGLIDAMKKMTPIPKK